MSKLQKEAEARKRRAARECPFRLEEAMERIKELEEEIERLRRRIIELESRNETGFGEWET